MDQVFEIQDTVLTKYTGSEADVVIPDGVTEIGKRAFAENAKLVTLKMPNSVVKIGNSAFEKCTKLKSVTFSENLEEICFDAFCRCKALKEITLPDTLRTLGNGVFGSCDKLSSIACNSKVFEPGGNPFSSYDTKTPMGLVDKDGFLIFMNILYQFVDPGETKEITVPQGVTHIMSNVFRSGVYSWERISQLEKAVIPDSVRYIGSHAFANCRKLKTIEMPAGIEISSKAFWGCEGLGDENGLFIHDGVVLEYFGNGDTLTIPKDVKAISSGVFATGYETNPGNKNLRTVLLPQGLETIGHSAFQDCDLLEEIHIPDSVRFIGNQAFAGCDHLARVRMGSQVEHMGESIFSGCKQLADENGFVIFHQTLFGYFGSDRTAEVPQGITEISQGCFNKSGIFSVKLPNTLKKLGSAFSGCDMLETIVIPDRVEIIPGSCFSCCSRLKQVTLPASLKRIGYGAFSGCSALEAITLPAGLEAIDSTAFEACSSLREIAVPDGVKILSRSAFSKCTALERVQLPRNLEAIGSWCFQNCESMKAIEIPASVKTIEAQAFSNCTALHRLTCGTIENLHLSAFANCPRLADTDGFTIVGSILWKYDGPGGDVVVPEGITELSPNVFREGSFYARRTYIKFRTTGSLERLSLPSTLKKIGQNALTGCTGLKALALPNGMEIIEAEAFRESGLVTISIPDSIFALQEGLFRECGALTGVTLPETLQAIGKDVFRGCSALASFAVPSGVIHIGEDAFRDCRILANIDVAEGNTVYAAYDGMLTNKAGDTLIVCPEGKGLTAYEIPSRFTTLAKHAFISCKALKKIVIPASVQNIGDEAFPRRDGWRGTGGLDVIEADPAAGGGSLGENLFDLCLWSDKPLCHPKLPLGLVKEQVGQTLLALAYCQEPEKYEGAYGEIYRKYAFSHEKTLVKKADSMKLTKVAEFFAAAGSGKKKAINYKKLSEQAKVELLEQAIVARDLAKAREVISGCGSFEFTARALGLACLYSTLDMVKLLVENGATFAYTYDSSLKRKYGAAYSTKYSQYPVSYSALIAKTDINIYNPIMFASVHSYQFGELPKITVPGNPGDVRADIAAYLVTVPSACFNAAEAMCCALRWGCTELAQRLKDLGTPLCVTAKPSLAETAASADRNEYLLCLAALPPEKCLFALKMFAELLGENQIILTQKVFETENSPFLDAEVIRFVFTHTDTSKLTKSKLVESATDRDDVSAVEALVGAGVFKNTAQRDKAIRYAMDSKKTQVLAWLMDYKNKTADLAAEAAKKEQKEMRELMEDPNSVSAMKKIWGYKKLEDGTLQITSYKGSDIHVEIPAKIGKAMVTVIGEEAFSGSEYGRWKNHMERRRIQSITIPEGVVEIGDSAFSMCESLETLVLPLSVKRVGTYAFSRCARLRDANGFVILNNTVYTYVDPTNTYDALVVPEGVTKIAPNAFKPHWSSDSCAKIQRIVLPESLVEIGDSAFEGLKQLTTVHIPAGVKVIGKRAFALTGLTSISFSEGLRHIGESAFTVTPLVQVRLPESLESIGPRAFYSCSKLRDLFISASLKTIGEELLGNYGDSSTYSWDTYHPSGVYVYTTPGSAAEEHMKQYGGVYVTYEEEQKG